MTNTMRARKSSAANETSRAARVLRGSDNVLRDLGIADAEDLSAKVRLAVEVNRILDEKGWTQARAARVFGVAQPHVSELRNYKLRHFSTDRLLGFLRRLNCDIEIVMRARREETEETEGTGSLSVRREAA